MAQTLRERALRALALREHTRLELRQKLLPHAATEEVEDILDRMQELGFLCDVRYAESYTRTHAGRFGPARLRAELNRRGVATEIVAQVLQANADEGPDEFDAARTVWQRKYDHAPADAREWARQARFLQSRGFAPEVIRKLLKDPFDEPA